ncbi:hypothetical protein CRG98_043159 [Punica granatum]|uniref:Stress response protein NST1-like n=1 Tax=Punica granatum TaxID=22663 RepID=A0A2I0HXM8_PUNGR|nr:hypothetical protein CRG98_043159 [Punica granatum]
MMPPRRKKWTEAEEKTLIDKYGEMVSNGTLAKMKTREKKFRPIACYVNSVHHLRDPVVFPWSWTWKDVSTKVQNMRHQYLLVKQKIKRPPRNTGGPEGDDVEEFDWMEGLTHWSNFLRYKEVFGDVGISCSDTMVGSSEGRNGGFFTDGPQVCPVREGDFGTDIDEGDDGGLGLGFDYEGGEVQRNYNNGSDTVRGDGDDGFVLEDVDANGSGSRKKSRIWKKRAWGFVIKQLWQLRDMEARNEQRQEEREREMQRRESRWAELERDWERKLEEREKEREETARSREEMRRQRVREWDAMERDSLDRERRRDKESLEEREWEERMNRRRLEWRKRIDERLDQHRAEMGQLQARIIHEQQSLTGQLLGFVSQWTGHTAGFSDHTGASNPYLSQVMQNLHHVNGIVHGDTGVDDGNQDDQFIVDG